MSSDIAYRLAMGSLQGGIVLSIALAVCFSAVAPNIKIWCLRIGLVKLFVGALFVGGFAVANSPQSLVGQFGLVPLLVQATVALWAFSVAVGLIRLIRNHLSLSRLIREAKPEKDPATLEIYRAICRKSGTSNAPVLCRHSGLRSPVLAKMGSSFILLPEQPLSTEELKAVMAHELAHYRRRDLVWSWLATVTDLCFFFHPLAVLALRKLRFYEECAADAEALRLADTAPAVYSKALVSFAENHLVVAGAFAMSGSARDLRGRITELFRAKRPTHLQLALLGAAFALGLVALLPWQIKPVEEPQRKVFAPIAAAF